MARPEPEVILAGHDPWHDRSVDIIRAESIWIICYQDRAIGVRHRLYTSRGATFKYPRASYTNRAHAYRMAQRLNDMFDTTEFTVKEIK